jgi:hypothetical protein
MTLYLFSLADHVGNADVGVVISFSAFGVDAKLERTVRTPLQAGETLLAFMKPDGPIQSHINIPHGTNLRTNSAIDALVVAVEMAIHQGKLPPKVPAGFSRQASRGHFLG